MNPARNVRHARQITLKDDVLTVPAYIHRTACGWQVRISRQHPSFHVADSAFLGGPRKSLEAAIQLRDEALTALQEKSQ